MARSIENPQRNVNTRDGAIGFPCTGARWPAVVWSNSMQHLPEEVRRVALEGGTESPFSGAYWNHHEAGVYRCVVCGTELFSSGAKFDSGTGWPSFDDPVAKDRIEFVEDMSHGMRRTEVKCATCHSQLGHVFPDGPTSTGERYCVNSVCLAFTPKTSESGSSS